MESDELIITLDTDGQKIRASYNSEIYSGLVGVLKIKLNNISRAGDSTVLRFYYGEDEPIDIIASNDTLVPANVIKSPGFAVAVGRYTMADGDILERFIPSNSIFIPISQNGYGSPDAATGTIGDVESLEGQLIALARTGENLPYIGANGNWYVYDVESREYTDSGKESKGERGLQGEQGERGEKGERGLQGEQGERGEKGERGLQGEQGEPGSDGYTPQRGVDYWTEEDVAGFQGDMQAMAAVAKDELETEIDKKLADDLTEYAKKAESVVEVGATANKASADLHTYYINYKTGDGVYKSTKLFAADNAQPTEDSDNLITSAAVYDALGDCVKKTDYATLDTPGVVRVHPRDNNPYGIHISDGVLRIACAGIDDINTKASYAKPIVPAMLDTAVKACTNQDLTAELTAEQSKLPPSTQAVKDALGDIETALDGIIALQNTLIGGDVV